MADLKRVQVAWSGAGVTGPGLSTFYFTSGATGFPADLQTFFQAVKSLLPTSVTIDVPNTGDTISEATGALTGVWTDSGGSSTVGTASGVFVAGTGYRVRWVTAGIRGGRRVVGSTFLCPATAAAFDTDGTPTAASLTVVRNAAIAYAAAVTPDMHIYSRETAPGAGDGISSAVLASTVPDKASWLRSRRT